MVIAPTTHATLQNEDKPLNEKAGRLLQEVHKSFGELKLDKSTKRYDIGAMVECAIFNRQYNLAKQIASQQQGDHEKAIARAQLADILRRINDTDHANVPEELEAARKLFAINKGLASFQLKNTVKDLLAKGESSFATKLIDASSQPWKEFEFRGQNGAASSNFNSICHIAVHHLQHGQKKQAQELFKKFGRAETRDAARNRSIEILLRDRNQDSFDSNYRLAQKLFDEHETDRLQFESSTSLTLSALENGRLRETKKYIREMEAHCSESKPDDRATLALTLISSAPLFQKQGELTGSLVKKAEKLKGNNPNFSFHLAIMHAVLGELGEASENQGDALQAIWRITGNKPTGFANLMLRDLDQPERIELALQLADQLHDGLLEAIALTNVSRTLPEGDRTERKRILDLAVEAIENEARLISSDKRFEYITKDFCIENTAVELAKSGYPIEAIELAKTLSNEKEKSFRLRGSKRNTTVGAIITATIKHDDLFIENDGDIIFELLDRISELPGLGDYAPISSLTWKFDDLGQDVQVEKTLAIFQKKFSTNLMIPNSIIKEMITEEDMEKFFHWHDAASETQQQRMLENFFMLHGYQPKHATRETVAKISKLVDATPERRSEFIFLLAGEFANGQMDAFEELYAQIEVASDRETLLVATVEQASVKQLPKLALRMVKQFDTPQKQYQQAQRASLIMASKNEKSADEFCKLTDDELPHLSVGAKLGCAMGLITELMQAEAALEGNE